jgi:hypothetical protein
MRAWIGLKISEQHEKYHDHAGRLSVSGVSGDFERIQIVEDVTTSYNRDRQHPQAALRISK